jgi:hypothetical protein
MFAKFSILFFIDVPLVYYYTFIRQMKVLIVEYRSDLKKPKSDLSGEEFRSAGGKFL